MTRVGSSARCTSAASGGVHYPAVHLFEHYRSLGYGDGDPNAERIGRRP
jgi:hypothetical protein